MGGHETWGAGAKLGACALPRSKAATGHIILNFSLQ